MRTWVSEARPRAALHGQGRNRTGDTTAGLGPEGGDEVQNARRLLRSDLSCEARWRGTATLLLAAPSGAGDHRQRDGSGRGAQDVATHRDTARGPGGFRFVPCPGIGIDGADRYRVNSQVRRSPERHDRTV